jgi:ATP-binding cassette subfamily B protein/ATP-binding cassette subfamily C protein
VSLIIRSGEKLSIVGQNGAGKTTFIKLLCKLYEPQEGEIRINGVNIREYSREEYNRLLAVVFQDFKLFSFSVKENISFYHNSEERKLYHALEKAGLKDRIDKLEQGIETSIYKNFDKEGVELSGGENQKMAIARAIYKDSPIVILDEPTAALDPYAEFEIYTRFNELVSNKTAIYISHRLSSCRFCDHIAVFDHGELVEYGTHKELEGKNGLYSKMWHTQAQYYA